MHSRKLSATTSLLLSSTIFLGQLVSPSVAFMPTGGLPSAAAGQQSSMSAAVSGPVLSTATTPSFSETRLSATGRVDAGKVNEDRPDWLPKLPNGCESDYECDGMESCCDYLLFKACCTDGHSQADWVPVPIPVRPQDGYYGGGGYYR